MWQQTSLGFSLQHSCSKFLKSSKFKTNFVRVMDFELLNLYSVTCLELYLTRKGEAHQTCKQTWQQLRIHSLNNIMVINFIFDFSWVLFLKESACNSLQKQKHQPFLHWCLESINSKLMLSEHNTQLLQLKIPCQRIWQQEKLLYSVSKASSLSLFYCPQYIFHVVKLMTVHGKQKITYSTDAILFMSIKKQERTCEKEVLEMSETERR